MFTSRRAFIALFSLVVLFLLSMPALAADPGDPLDTGTTVPNDQKAGSLLFFNIYTSSTTNPASNNTSITITNTSESQAAFVHLYFIDGTSCSVADRFFCLTRLQTLTFYADEQDPGITGYIVAIAVDGVDGAPTRFNYLIGVEYVKFATGHADALAAEAFIKLNDTNVISTDGSLAALFFDGLPLAGSYSRAPRVLAIDNIASRLDGNDTLVILNRVGGNLTSTAASLGNLFGLLYDEAEASFSFTITGGCQLRFTLNDVNPRVTPRFSRIVPANATGWLKIWPTSDVGMLGSVINFNPNAAQGGGFNGGHNLHKLTLSGAANYVVPVFPPGC